MSLCINPRCPQPDHPGNDNGYFCQCCGLDLLLQNRYRVMRLLSDSSGFGRVYEAYERNIPKILKVLKEVHSRDPKVVELFQQEAAVLSQLKHPGIPKIDSEGYFQILPQGAAYPLHCIVMEKIDGPDLLQWMQQQGNHPISEKQALNWLQQLAEILHLVHKCNYFHRDIKPQNIMIRSTGQLVLIDFGVAREMTYTYLAQVGGVGNVTKVSSAGYTPPEQEKGRAVPQSDFYALGRTLIYLLTGKHLVDDGIYDSLTDEFAWRSHAPQISPALADLIDYLSAPKATDRPKDTLELLEAVKSVSQAVPTSQVSALEPATTLESPVVRRPFPWLWGGMAGLVLGLTGYGVWRSLPHATPSQESIAVIKTLTGHRSFVNYLVFSPDGQTLVSASADKTIKVWDLSTGAVIRTLTGHHSFINALLISPDGENLISAGADKTIKIWSLTSGQLLRTLTGHTNYINAIALSPDGQTLVDGSADKTIKVWDWHRGRELRTLRGHDSYVNALAISADGKILVSGSADKTIKIWNLQTGQELRTLQGHSSYINAIALSPDGKTLVSGSADQTIKIWDLVTGQVQRTLTGHHNFVNYLAISPDGQTLVSGSADRTVKFWNLRTGQELRTLVGYDNPINYFAISPDWRTIATGSGERAIQLWQVPKAR